jgi:hypothetical protein
MARTKSTLEKQAIRRQAIYNRFGDSTLATKAKQWSDERIEYELGIKIPKTKPVAKTFTKERKAELEVQKTRFFEARNYLLKNYGEYTNEDTAHIQELTKSRFTLKSIFASLDANYESGLPFTNIKKGILKNVQKATRIQNWAKWASNNHLYPRQIVKLARKYNKENKLDKDANYGYAVCYYAYIGFKEPDLMAKELKPIDYKGELYINVRRTN